MMETALLSGRARAEGVRAGELAGGVVLDLVVERVRLRARRRLVWLSQLSNGDAGDPDGGPLLGALEDRDHPRRERAWLDESGSVTALDREIDRVERLWAGEDGEPFRRLEGLFGFSPSESDLLQTCLAPLVDPELAPVYAALQGHAARTYATDYLAARLFGYGRRSLWNPAAPLAAWGWVAEGAAAPGEPVPLRCDPLVRDWLVGGAAVDGELLGVLTEVEPREGPPSWPVERTAEILLSAIERGRGVRLLVTGPPGSGRRTFAATAAAAAGIRTLALDTGRIHDDDWPWQFVRAQRTALLWQAALVLHGSELERPWPGRVPASPIQFVACDNEELPPHEGLADHRFELPYPEVTERRELWTRLVPESAAWSDEEREELAGRYRLSVGHIASLGRRHPRSASQASALCRELTRGGLGHMGRLLDCPFGWSDLFVPQRLRRDLRDFTFEARDRVVFWESPRVRRLFPRGRGLVGLLVGPPGTGKTMAAQVIAADLAIDLFRVDLASAVSKYIGETAKRLRRIFVQAERMNALLLFDEADALFSKRTEVKDAHDRYANADTNYLLQLLEEFQGIALLASNKKGNIDPAFTRRLRYLFQFPRPKPDLRLAIWRQVLGEIADPETVTREARHLEALAAELELSGAEIKNAILAGAFVARRQRQALGLAHLLTGIDRELAKQGRSLTTQQLDKLDPKGRAHVA